MFFKERFDSFVDSDSDDLSKDSLDYKNNMKLIVCKEANTNLLNENKRLRQQLITLQDEMKEQEEKFFQAINEAREDRRKLDEMSHNEHK